MSNKLIETILTIITAALQALPEKKGKVVLEEALAAAQEALNSDDFKATLEKIVGKKAKTKATGEKKLKDENAPKRPKSAYLFFAEKKRPEIKAENPDLKMTEVAKILGERWKDATPQCKAKYVKKAEQAKLLYKEAMKDYVRPGDDVLVEQKINQKKKRGKQSTGDKKRKKKPEGAPKGPKSAYMFFCAAKRAEVKAENPDWKMTDIAKELGRMWKEDFPTDEDREEFIVQSTEDKERYAQEKAEWQETNPVEEKPKRKRSSKKAPKEESEEN
jgi:HMG (high mobility group) box